VYVEFLRSPDISGMHNGWVLEVSRSPAELAQCLQEEPDLVKCLDLLIRAKHSNKVENLTSKDPKWFVEPSLADPILSILEHNGVHMNDQVYKSRDLRCRHIIVSERYYRSVQNAIKRLPKRHKVKIKREAPLQVFRRDMMVVPKDPDPDLGLGEQDHIEMASSEDDIFSEQSSESDDVIRQLSLMDHPLYGESCRCQYTLQEYYFWLRCYCDRCMYENLL